MTTLSETTPGRDLKRRFVWLGLAMVLGMVVLSVQLYRLQITQGEEYAAKSVANFVKEVRLRADRGLIKDRRGAILVDSRPSFDAFITPAFCTNCADEVLPRLGELLGWDEPTRKRMEDQIRIARRAAPFIPLPVRVDLTRDEYDRINARRDMLDGVEVVPVPHRNYRTGSVLSHVLGYMNEINPEELERLNAEGGHYALGDYVGRRGLERSFEYALCGTDGVRKEVVNARGRVLEEFNNKLGQDTMLPSRPGNNLVLSLDMRLQEAAEQAFPGSAGAMVVVDVKTGFIRALVSRPGFDSNLLTGRITPSQMYALARDPLQPMVNRVSANHFSPGSTFKVISTLAAYKSGLFRPESTVTCTGSYRLGARAWRCHKDSGHGPVNGKTALQYSCDSWFYKVADTIGLDPIADMAKSLGMGSPTGIGVLAEVPGIMPSTEYHDKVSPGGYTKGMALNSVMGQGDVNATPLQVVMLYAAIANGGTLFKPQLVERVEGLDGSVVEKFDPQVVRKVTIPEAHRKAVMDALVATVNEPGGTAYRAAAGVREHLKEVVIAGKTGSAQVAAIGAVRLKEHQMDFFQRDHAWFAGIAPADDPEIAIVVLNEHGGHGGADAAPGGMIVLQKYFELKKEDAARAKADTSAPALETAPIQNQGTLSRGTQPPAAGTGGSDAVAH
ncbi:penicillin-binding protein 2 [Archangium primigenium]|uniref:penicillin-binding protein 2 n=1 Tax=[Archangium] primigenium TaxID=2792470 RepID=UPI001EF97DF5|nr:penicillin-binding protein 2 [Archangium primigenium]